MKETLLGMLGLTCCWASAMAEEDAGDWRDELLQREGIGLSKEALEKALKGEERPLPDLEKIFEQLGADGFSEREKAQEELLRGGEATLKWLREREPSQVPEVQRRITEVTKLLGFTHRNERKMAVEHAVKSLLAEGNERKENTGGLFYEWFGEGQAKLGKSYRVLTFENAANRGGAVVGGQLVFTGEGGQDGDQRLVLHSKKWPGEETFGEAFQVFAKLRGESTGMGAWHLGISIGRVRALYHPGLKGGSFRFERIDNHDYLSRTGSVGFTPKEEVPQWMSVKVRRLPDNKVSLEVVLEQGGKKEGRFETSVIVEADQIGELDEVSLDRSGRVGGSAYFDDFTVRILGE